MLDKRSFALGFLACAILGVFMMWTGLDNQLKSLGRYISESIDLPKIEVVPGSTAIKTYQFPVDPTVDAWCVGHGPTCGHKLVEFQDAPDNSTLGMMRAYITTKDGKFFVYVLDVEPGITLTEDWRALGIYDSISNVTWVINQGDTDDNELIIVAGTKACRANPSVEKVECQ